MNLVFKNPLPLLQELVQSFFAELKLAETKGYLLYNTIHTLHTICMYVAQHYTYTVTQHNTQQARTYIYIYVYKCPRPS